MSVRIVSLPPDDAPRPSRWQPWYARPAVDLPWAARKRAEEQPQEPARAVARWQPWFSTVPVAVDSLPWLVRRAASIEQEEQPRRAPWIWLTTTSPAAVDSLPWLVRRPAQEEAETALRRPSSVWLTTATPADGLAWLKRQRLAQDEEQAILRARWLPQVYPAQDGLPWRTSVAGAIQEADGIYRPVRWQPWLTAPVDTFGWLFRNYHWSEAVFVPGASRGWSMPWNSPQPQPPPPTPIIRPVGFAVSASPIGSAVPGAPEGVVTPGSPLADVN